MDENQRIYQRLIVDLTAEAKSEGSINPSFPVIIYDIGPEGVGFSCKERLKDGTRHILSIDLNGHKVVIVVEVRWIALTEGGKSFRVGAKVVDAKEEDLEAFVRYYCERLFPIPRGKKRILVVEDEIEMSKLLNLELTKNNYDVVCAFDGEEAYTKYLREKPDLIILDIMLPKLNGYEVCRKIRREQEDAHTPILMLTAKKGDVDRIVAGVIGAHRYLTKPFEAEELLKEIEILLNSSQEE